MIKLKPKKCKGTGKAVGYGCGELNLVRRYGLGLKCGCFNNWLLNSAAGKEMLLKTIKRSKKRVEQEEKKKLRELKEKHKSIAALKEEARKPFQEFIRMRDANLVCISCGNYSEIWDGGHYYKAELYSGLIFDEINVNKQCKHCNKYLDGNESGYRLGLIKKYGEQKINELDERAILTKNYKFERDELIEIKQKYKNKIKYFKKN